MLPQQRRQNSSDQWAHPVDDMSDPLPGDQGWSKSAGRVHCGAGKRATNQDIKDQDEPYAEASHFWGVRIHAGPEHRGYQEEGQDRLDADRLAERVMELAITGAPSDTARVTPMG